VEYFNFWARAQKNGPDFPVVCWGYSNESQEAALKLAEQKADQAIEKLSNPGRDRGGYYAANPLKERVIEQILDGEKVIAVVTRNAYGALVLNTAHVAFLDIDLARAKHRGPLVSLWRKLTGEGIENQAEEQVQHIRNALANVPEIAGRIYATANGYRVLITSAIFDPKDPILGKLMEELGVDELYQKLCLRQNCFRARLTPKPWRVGAPRPPVRYPLVGAYSRTYQAWLEKYEGRSKKYRVCRLIESFGSQPVCAEAALIMRLHDADLADDSFKLA
jgi:hypothetical protein